MGIYQSRLFDNNSRITHYSFCTSWVSTGAQCQWMALFNNISLVEKATRISLDGSSISDISYQSYLEQYFFYYSCPLWI